jgi:hypothetical protein
MYYNQFGNSTVPRIVGNSKLTPELKLLRLAQEYAKHPQNNTLSSIFPVEVEPERMVTIMRKKSSIPSTTPSVELGKNDVITSNDADAFEIMAVTPIHLRETRSLQHGYMNNRVAPGTINQRWAPEEQIAETVRQVVERQNFTWDVLRAQVLQGGINYTDSRTKTITRQQSFIPEANYWHYSITDGYQGRIDSNAFRNIANSNSDVSVGGVPWTDPNADLLKSFRTIAHWHLMTHKARVTKILMHPELMHVLAFNNQVKMSRGAIVLNAPLGSNPVVPSGGDSSMSMEFVTDSMGLRSIAGVPIDPLFANYSDPETGVSTTLLAKNKVIYICEQDFNGVNRVPGYTKITYSEAANGGEPGMWIRYNEDPPAPAAPGITVQIGISGMPVLVYPDAVGNMVVAEIANVDAAQGVVPLYNLNVI